MVLDGSTNAPDSGILARQIIRDMVDWYVASDEAVNAVSLTVQLKELHGKMSRQYPRSSSSYMIARIKNDSLLVVHAGDCLLGRRGKTNEIEWLNQPHTLANAAGPVPVTAIAGLTTRHRLTRSFRAREFHAPDAMELNIEKEFVLATDGFWAELGKQDQARFLEGQTITVPVDGDDCSVLRIRFEDAGPDKGVRYDGKSTDGFYAKGRS